MVLHNLKVIIILLPTKQWERVSFDCQPNLAFQYSTEKKKAIILDESGMTYTSCHSTVKPPLSGIRTSEIRAPHSTMQPSRAILLIKSPEVGVVTSMGVTCYSISTFLSYGQI